MVVHDSKILPPSAALPLASSIQRHTHMVSEVGTVHLAAAPSATIHRAATATYGRRRKLADPDTSVSSPPTSSNGIFDTCISPRIRRSGSIRDGDELDRSLADTACTTTESSASEDEKQESSRVHDGQLSIQIGLARKVMADDDGEEMDELEGPVGDTLVGTDSGPKMIGSRGISSPSSDPFTGSLSSAPPVTSSASVDFASTKLPGESGADDGGLASPSRQLAITSRTSESSNDDDDLVLSTTRARRKQQLPGPLARDSSSAFPSLVGSRLELRRQRLRQLARSRRAGCKTSSNLDSDDQGALDRNPTGHDDDEEVTSDDLSPPSVRRRAHNACHKAQQSGKGRKQASVAPAANDDDDDVDSDSDSSTNEDRPRKAQKRLSRKSHATKKIKPLKKSEREDMDRMTAKLHRERSVALKKEAPQHYAITNFIDKFAAPKLKQTSPSPGSLMQDPSDPIIEDVEMSSRGKGSKYARNGSSSPIQHSSTRKSGPLTAGRSATIQPLPLENSDEEDDLMDPKELLEQSRKAAQLREAKEKAMAASASSRTVAQMLRGAGHRSVEDDDLEVVSLPGALTSKRPSAGPSALVASRKPGTPELKGLHRPSRRAHISSAREAASFEAGMQKRVREQNIKARLSNAPHRRVNTHASASESVEDSVATLLQLAKENVMAAHTAATTSDGDSDDESAYEPDMPERRRGSGSETGLVKSDNERSNSDDSMSPGHLSSDDDKENTPSQSQSSLPKLGSAAVIDDDEGSAPLPARRQRKKLAPLLDSDDEVDVVQADLNSQGEDSSQRQPLQPLSPDEVPMPSGQKEGNVSGVDLISTSARHYPPSPSMQPPLAHATAASQSELSSDAPAARTASSIMGAFFQDGTQNDSIGETLDVVRREGGTGGVSMTQMFELDSQPGVQAFDALRAMEAADGDVEYPATGLMMQTPISLRNRDAAALARADELERQQRQQAAMLSSKQYLGNDGLFTQTKPTRYFTDTQSYDQSQVESLYPSLPEPESIRLLEPGDVFNTNTAAPRTISPSKRATRRFHRGFEASFQDDSDGEGYLEERMGSRDISKGKSVSPAPTAFGPRNAFEILREGAKRQATGHPNAVDLNHIPVRSERSHFVVGEAEESDEDDTAVTALGKRRTQGGLGNIFDEHGSAKGSDDGDDSDDDDAASLEDLVHNEREDDEADKDILARERFQQDIQADDAAQLALHQKAVDGELRKKKRQNDGDFMTYLDDDQEDEMYRNRVRNPGAGRSKKRDVGGEDEMEKLALDETTAPFYRAYHGQTGPLEDDLSFIHAPVSEDSEEENDASDDEPGKYISHTEVQRQIRERARQKRKRAPVVSVSDEDEDTDGGEKKKTKEAWESDEDRDDIVVPALLRNRVLEKSKTGSTSRVQGSRIAFEESQLPEADDEDPMVRLLEKRAPKERPTAVLLDPESAAAASKWGALKDSAPERRRGNPSRLGRALSLSSKKRVGGTESLERQAADAQTRKAKRQEAQAKHSRLINVFDRESHFSESQ